MTQNPKTPLCPWRVQGLPDVQSTTFFRKGLVQGVYGVFKTLKTMLFKDQALRETPIPTFGGCHA